MSFLLSLDLSLRRVVVSGLAAGYSRLRGPQLVFNTKHGYYDFACEMRIVFLKDDRACEMNVLKVKQITI